VHSTRTHATLAVMLSRWLVKTAESLAERNYPFEACEAERLAEDFIDYHDDPDGSPEGFLLLWQELEGWAETDISTGRRDLTICALPPLPETLEI
jgi:hypothetical protein